MPLLDTTLFILHDYVPKRISPEFVATRRISVYELARREGELWWVFCCSRYVCPTPDWACFPYKKSPILYMTSMDERLEWVFPGCAIRFKPSDLDGILTLEQDYKRFNIGWED